MGELIAMEVPMVKMGGLMTDNDDTALERIIMVIENRGCEDSTVFLLRRTAMIVRIISTRSTYLYMLQYYEPTLIRHSKIPLTSPCEVSYERTAIVRYS